MRCRQRAACPPQAIVNHRLRSGRLASPLRRGAPPRAPRPSRMCRRHHARTPGAWTVLFHQPWRRGVVLLRAAAMSRRNPAGRRCRALGGHASLMGRRMRALRARRTERHRERHRSALGRHLAPAAERPIHPVLVTRRKRSAGRCAAGRPGPRGRPAPLSDARWSTTSRPARRRGGAPRKAREAAAAESAVDDRLRRPAALWRHRIRQLRRSNGQRPSGASAASALPGRAAPAPRRPLR